MQLGAGSDRLPTPEERLAILRLFRTENIGPATYRQLLARFRSAQAALDALPRFTERAGRNLIPISLAQAEDELATIEAMGARLVVEAEPDYPEHLRHISAAPPAVTILGGASVNWVRTAGIVGARNASSAGLKMARLLAEGLGEASFTVVSGLARGIDAAAHRAALRGGTIGVLAGGLDRIYPREHVGLAEEIVAAGGALLTEMPMGWEPRAQDFPRRNRLVSGLSLGIVVVEAAKRSGSLITARLALEQNREVLAVPGSPLDPRAEGGNHLIQQGARLVTCANDIVEVLDDASPARGMLFEPDWQPDYEPGPEHVPTEGDAELLRQALSATPVAIDDIIETTGIRAGALQMLLLELDIAGDIEWSSGQMVALRFQ